MRNTEERVAAVKRRALNMERNKWAKHAHIISISSVAACLALTIGLSLAMPRLVTNFSNGEAVSPSMTASIFYGNNSLGYIIIGLLAFSLGICVTILCYRIHRLHHLEEPVDHDEETVEDDSHG